MSGKEAGESAPPVEIPMTEAKPRPARKARRRFPVLRRLGQLFSGLVMLGLLIFGGAIAAIETGLFDAMLNERAQAALNDALGPRFMAKVGSTAIRLTADGKLALEARHVDTIDLATGQHMSQAASIRLAVDPKALFSGEIAVNHIEADDVEVDATLLPSGKPLDLKALRVDQVPRRWKACSCNWIRWAASSRGLIPTVSAFPRYRSSCRPAATSRCPSRCRNST